MQIWEERTILNGRNQACLLPPQWSTRSFSQRVSKRLLIPFSFPQRQKWRFDIWSQRLSESIDHTGSSLNRSYTPLNIDLYIILTIWSIL